MAKKVAAKRKVSSKKPSGVRKRAKKTQPGGSKRKVSPLKKVDNQPRIERSVALRRKKAEKALETYGKALDSLQRGRLDAAAKLLNKVIEDFPEEKELHERSRLYLEVCDRRAATESKPETTQERVYAATVALNNGDLSGALSLIEPAISEQPNSDQLQYMAALVRAEMGETEIAISHLHRAVEINPDNRFVARSESSFESLHPNESFQEIIDPVDEHESQDETAS